MTVESQEMGAFRRRETHPVSTLDNLPHEIILGIGEALLTKPRRTNGSGVCNWIRTSTRYAEILVPLLYRNALLPLKPISDKYSARAYISTRYVELLPPKPVSDKNPGVISTPPHRMWRCALKWESDFVFGYFSALGLDWITKVRFYVERGTRGRFGSSGLDDLEYMINKVARSGNAKLVQLVLAKGVSPSEGQPLLTAVEEGHFDVVKVLLDAGAEVSYRQRADGGLLNVPLCSAIALHTRSKSKDIVPLLIERMRSNGGSFEYPGSDDTLIIRTPLYNAVEQSSINIVRLLLDYGADPFTALNPTCRGHTPCHNLHTGAHTEQGISFMLFNKMEEKDHDRFLGIVDNMGNTPLHNAIIFQEWPLVRRCIELGFDVSGAKNNGDNDNALHLAIRHNAPLSVLDLILAKGPESWDEPKDMKFQKLFWWLVENSKFQGLTTLIELRKNRKITFDHSEVRLGENLFFPSGNALHVVCGYNKVGKDMNSKTPKIVETLLHLGVSPNLQDEKDKRTPLLALLHRNPVHPSLSVVELLIEHMSESALATQDHEGSTSLHVACRYADVPTVRSLLSKMDHASILLTSKFYGNTALHNLLEPLRHKYQDVECSEILRLLIQHNPEIVHIRDFSGNTPLHMFTLWSEHFQDIKNLHEAGADLSALNKDGEPPFHMNSSTRLPQVTQLLLDSGADMHEKCKACRTDLADFKGREKIPVVVSEATEVSSVIKDNASLGLSDLLG